MGKKKKPNMTKVLSDIMLELYNIRMKSSNMIKKIREPSNVTNELSQMILEMHNVMIEPSNVTEKKKKKNHQMWQKYRQM